MRVVLDEGEQPYLAVRAGAVCYLLDDKQRLYRLAQRAGRTEWRVFTANGTVRLDDTAPFDLQLN